MGEVMLSASQNMHFKLESFDPLDQRFYIELSLILINIKIRKP